MHTIWKIEEVLDRFTINIPSSGKRYSLPGVEEPNQSRLYEIQ